VTGGRVKIGYQTALKLLRAGARTIVSTRFPNDAALRFSREEDFGDWKNRLQILGLDLRHSPSVEMFARYIANTEERLDILVNNAAQTVRKPPGFYRHLMEWESKSTQELPETLQPLLALQDACKRMLESSHPVLTGENLQSTVLKSWPGKSAAIGIQASAQLAMIPYNFDDETQADLEIFPEGKLDADLQQVDLRKINTWRLTLGDVSTPEMLEVHLVNAVAPFILAAKLKPLMLRHPEGEKYIVNASAMEGKFTRWTKTDKHPHTNMAKAALNMLTLTSAPDYAKSRIYMNAVDTGWITDEDPAELSQSKKDMHDFEPPLDIVDGAARLLDPVFYGILTGDPVFGKFLKDYKPTDW
jgi:NAD(P)-dependent dehydrogenase (short-subunit alcohol dehydrogenase family)